VDLLLEAMDQVIAKLPQAHLHIFGGGPLESQIRAQAKQGRLAAHVTVHGFADPATVVAYCKACDALVIPSRQESMPVIYSDALQCGCPVIATDVGDLGRVIREQQTGELCPPENSAALAEAMLRFVAHGRASYIPKLIASAELFAPGRSARRCVEAFAMNKRICN
jgi:glycosyltransferase involved in cell wall biosynthesis